MDVELRYLEVNRVIVHTIIEKTLAQPHATTEYSDEIIRIVPAVKDVLKKRITQATGKESKSFVLDIVEHNEGSFFDIASTIFKKNDDDFIRDSQTLCEMLAEKQTRQGLSGGYFIVIDGYCDNTKLPILIVIKAEPQEVLQQVRKGNMSFLEVLDKVFLSPAQKLFKLGILAQVDFSKSDKIDYRDFRGLIFDSQFSSGSNPAEYFYKDFLGFNLRSNSKLLTRDFFVKTEAFIEEKCNGIEKFEKIWLLKSLLLVSNQTTINPTEIKELLFDPSNTTLRDDYLWDVEEHFPSTFIKDNTVLKNLLMKNTLEFQNNINLYGPAEKFKDSVEVVSDLSNLSQSDIDGGEYTILKITGKLK